MTGHDELRPPIPGSIQVEYLDNADRPTRIGATTVDALRAALGEPDPGLADRAPVVRHPGDPLDVPGWPG